MSDICIFKYSYCVKKMLKLWRLKHNKRQNYVVCSVYSDLWKIYLARGSNGWKMLEVLNHSFSTAITPVEYYTRTLLCTPLLWWHLTNCMFKGKLLPISFWSLKLPYISYYIHRWSINRFLVLPNRCMRYCWILAMKEFETPYRSIDENVNWWQAFDILT